MISARQNKTKSNDGVERGALPGLADGGGARGEGQTVFSIFSISFWLCVLRGCHNNAGKMRHALKSIFLMTDGQQ